MQKYLILFLFPLIAFAQMGSDTRLGKFDQLDSNTATEISILKELEALTTGAWKLPIGNTAARPTGTAGQIRYNSELLTFEGYTDAWGPIAGGGGLIVWEEALDLEVGDLVYRDYNKKIYRVITLHTTTATFDEDKMIEIANSSAFSLLKNPDFENTIVEHACTDATAAFVDTTLPIYNNFKMFQMTVSVIGGYCDFTATTGAALEGLFFKMGALFQTTLVGVEYCTLVNGVVDNCIPVDAGTTWKQPFSTQSNAGATSVGVRVRSTLATGVVNVEKLHLSMGGLPTSPTVNCNGELDCANTFSAFVSSAGVVSQETGGDWINGNGVPSSPSITLTITSGLLTSGMNCLAVGAQRSEVLVATSSTTTVVVNQFSSAGSALLGNFYIECTKTGTDYKSLTQQGAVNVGDDPSGQVLELQQGAGTGSTNTRIRYFTNTITDRGNVYFDYENSATLGFSATFKRDAIVTVSYSDQNSSSLQMGISLNSTQLTTDIQSITSADVMVMGTSFAAAPSSVTKRFRVSSGDVIRPHIRGTGWANSLSATNFSITAESVTSTVNASIATNFVSGGAEVLTADTWDTKPIYRRCYEIAVTLSTSATIDTIPTGLEPVEAFNLSAANPTRAYLNFAATSGTDAGEVHYDSATGLIRYAKVGTSFSLNAGTRFCFKYTYP